MSDAAPQKMSRREWFRLRAHAPRTLSAGNQKALSSDEPLALTSIEHPPNHDGMDLTELPPMREAILTDQQVRDLFADIAAVATDVLLMQRSSQTPRATASRAATTESLKTALHALLANDVRRIQIRYRWQKTLWIDTLESKPEGYRIVRIAHAS